MPVVYPVLIGEISKRGIKKSVIASRIGLSERCLYNKLSGMSSFTWEEICTITECFFPDFAKDKDELFRKAESNTRDSA